jgi:hypothetical protein
VNENGHIVMTTQVEESFSGKVEPSLSEYTLCQTTTSPCHSHYLSRRPRARAYRARRRRQGLEREIDLDTQEVEPAFVFGGLLLDRPVDHLLDHRTRAAEEDLLAGLEEKEVDHSGDVEHRTGRSHMAEGQVGDLVASNVRS